MLVNRERALTPATGGRLESLPISLPCQVHYSTTPSSADDDGAGVIGGRFSWGQHSKFQAEQGLQSRPWGPRESHN